MRGSFEPSDPGAIQEIVRQALGDQAPIDAEPVGDGLSTVVYRLSRGGKVFYLRILPDLGDSFAPEAYAHSLLRSRGVHVPDVIYLEHCNEILRRSVMVTTEIRGLSLDHLGHDATEVLREAGRELAIINSVPVEGFGWIKRECAAVTCLEAEQPSNRAFLLEDLDRSLSVLADTALTAREVNAVRDLIRSHTNLLDVDHASLAHGDFDVTHIYQEQGRYTGIIDFGEIRGTDPYYDLGHFRLHDAETLPSYGLPALLAGYREVRPLPPAYEQQIALQSLLVGIRFLARGAAGKSRHGLSSDARAHAQGSIRRDLQLLEGKGQDIR